MIKILKSLSVLLLLAGVSSADTFLINFESVPPEPTEPSLFSAAGPAQTIVVPNVATISGGVILGNETNLPAQSYATPPNVYATAGFGDNLSSTLTLTLNPAFGTVSEVSFPVLNGSTQPESYLVDGFDGMTLVTSQLLSNVASNASSGFGIVDLNAASITSVTVAPVLLDASCCSGWDYSIDSIALNESVQTAVGTPEPGTFALFGSAIIGLLALRRGRFAR